MDPRAAAPVVTVAQLAHIAPLRVSTRRLVSMTREIPMVMVAARADLPREAMAGTEAMAAPLAVDPVADTAALLAADLVADLVADTAAPQVGVAAAATEAQVAVVDMPAHQAMAAMVALAAALAVDTEALQAAAAEMAMEAPQVEEEEAATAAPAALVADMEALQVEEAVAPATEAPQEVRQVTVHLDEVQSREEEEAAEAATNPNLLKRTNHSRESLLRTRQTSRSYP